MCSLMGWYACIAPWNSEWQASVQTTLCYVLTFLPAVVSQFTQPLSSMDLFFARVTWCHNCSTQEAVWRHLRVAVPVYVALFYMPAVLKSVVAHSRVLRRRILIFSVLFPVTTSILFLSTASGDRGDEVRAAGFWLLIWAAVATVVWSSLGDSIKRVSVLGIILIGAAFLPSTMQPSFASDVGGVSVFIAQVFIVAAVTAVFLTGFWCFEKLFKRQ